ncbi:MAG: hypothetical protein JWO65_2616 [Sphingomonas bacterium]|jgi:hypothetical protein|nr:hypothetical protein [Sphingomonas bacterium]
MRIIDRKRFELRCVCGAQGIHPVADAYVQHAVSCRTCRRRTKLDAETLQALAEHLDKAVDEILTERDTQR